MSEGLTPSMVQRIARLARLHPAEDELTPFAADLSAVLSHIKTLRGLNVTEVEPLAHPLGLTNRLDEDEVEPSLAQAEVLALAPGSLGAFFSVPKMFAEGDGDKSSGGGGREA